METTIEMPQGPETQVKISGHVTLITYNEDGNEIAKSESDNLVVNTGLALMTDLLGGPGLRPGIIKFGSSTTPTTAGMTDLVSSYAEEPVTDIITTDEGGYQVIFQTSFGAYHVRGKTVGEVGLFNAASEMFARANPEPVQSFSASANVLVIAHYAFSFSAP